MFEELFVRRKFYREQALAFDFIENNYNYLTDILDGAFQLQMKISSEGLVDTEFVEKEADEKYILYKTNFVDVTCLRDGR